MILWANKRLFIVIRSHDYWQKALPEAYLMNCNVIVIKT